MNFGSEFRDRPWDRPRFVYTGFRSIAEHWFQSITEVNLAPSQLTKQAFSELLRLRVILVGPRKH